MDARAAMQRSQPPIDLLRPEILFPLFAPVTSLKGVGPRFGKLFERLTGPAAVDLLWHLPNGLIDRTHKPKIAQARAGEIATIKLIVDRHIEPYNPRQPYRVRCHDETGFLHLVYFHVKGDYLEKLLPPGTTRWVSGQVEHFNNEIQITHPDHVLDLAEAEQMKPIEPVYGLTAGLPQRTVQKAVAAALGRVPVVAEWIDPGLIKQRQWLGWGTALAAAHAPESDQDLTPQTPARQRLAYDELLANQLAIALVRAHTKRLPGRSIKVAGALRQKVTDALPFSLTPSQRQALAEIAGDMAAPSRMLRLLQGDVGSGKTVVALLAMLDTVEAGAQAALMAPTEILARQHFATLTKLAAASGVTVGLLTGREKGRARESLLASLAQGQIGIAVGTHALFQEDVVFKDLALAVIDEQHRFGVEQRQKRFAKGETPDILVMTATPIPRSLALVEYGDLEMSVIDELPPGRKGVKTAVRNPSQLDRVHAFIDDEITRGAQAYVVYPIIEESEKLNLTPLKQGFEAIAKRFPARRVAMIHGRMSADEK